MATSTSSSAVASASATLASSTDASDTWTDTFTGYPTSMGPVPLTTQYTFPPDCNHDAMYNFTINTATYGTHWGLRGSLGKNVFVTLIET